MRAISSLILYAVALLAVPAAAQQSPRDFTLPPPKAEPAQGPVDDSGLVPLAPRAIPVQAPVQEPADDAADDAVTGADPAPGTRVTPGGSDAHTNRDAGRPGTAQTAPVRSRANPSPGQAIESPASGSLAVPGAEARSDTAQTSAPPAPLLPMDAATDPDDRWAAMPIWQWALAGALALLAGLMLSALTLRRRRISRQVPAIEPPLAGPLVIANNFANDGTDPGHSVELAVEITGLSRSLMMLTADCHLSIANRSHRPLRDLSIFADITSAHRSLPTDRQLALEGTVLPLRVTLDRIGPNQSQTVKFSLQLPVRDLAAFRRGEATICVPLLRIKVEGPAIGCRVQTHVVGLANGNATGRLLPVPLHTPPGSYPDVRARVLA